MGMEADLIAIGRFTPEVANYLDYPAEFYEDVKQGTPVHTTVLRCNTSSQSRELAEILKVDPNDFNTHFIHRSRFSDERVEELQEWSLESLQDDVGDMVKALALHGFQFFYLPNM